MVPKHLSFLNLFIHATNQKQILKLYFFIKFFSCHLLVTSPSFLFQSISTDTHVSQADSFLIPKTEQLVISASHLIAASHLMWSLSLSFKIAIALPACTAHYPGWVVKVTVMLTLFSVTVLNKKFPLKGLRPLSSQLLITIITNLKDSLVRTQTISCNKSAMKKLAQFISLIHVLMSYHVQIRGCKIKLSLLSCYTVFLGSESSPTHLSPKLTLNITLQQLIRQSTREVTCSQSTTPDNCVAS